VELAALRLDPLGLTTNSEGSRSPEVKSFPSSAIGPEGPSSLDALNEDLRTRTPEGRVVLFRALSALANARAGTNLGANGELGFLTRRDLLPEIGDRIFTSGVERGDVIGPVSLDGQSILFLVEARYDGVLDRRSIGALAAAREPDANLVSLAAELSGTDVALARDSGWFSQAEFASGNPIGVSLFTTEPGGLTDPIVLDGQLAVLEPIETRAAVPTGSVRDRLTVGGFSTWFAAERTRAAVVLDADPLGAGRLAPSESPAPVRTKAPLATPFLPVIPGQATPAPTT
jgi:hypothetical protein